MARGLILSTEPEAFPGRGLVRVERQASKFLVIFSENHFR